MCAPRAERGHPPPGARTVSCCAVMLAIRLASAPDPTDPAPPPPSTTPSTNAPAPPPDTGGGTGGTDEELGIVPSIWDVIVEVWDNLGENGYQTGTSLIFATVSVIIMRSLKVSMWIMIPVAVGAFWAGWLLWNTLTGQENPLFPGDISAIKIWDVALDDQWGFLIAVIAGCIAAVALWRSSQSNLTRLILITGTVFGASLVYNLVESVRITAA